MSDETVTFRVYLHGESEASRSTCNLEAFTAFYRVRRHPLTGAPRVKFLPPFADLKLDHGERLGRKKTQRLRDVLRLLAARVTVVNGGNDAP